MKIIYLVFVTVFYSATTAIANSGIPDPQTTRVISSAGAGVGSLNLNESTLLNPASVVFYNKSGFLYQKTQHSIDEKSKDRTDGYDNGTTDIINIIDTSSAVKGGLSYQKQNLQEGDRKRFSASLAGTVSESAALGFIYRYTEEDSEIIDNETYNQFVVGFTQVFTENLIFGFTTVDPVQDNPEYFNYTFGIHYTVNEFIDIIADIGSGDVQNYSDESFNKWAIQLKTFSDFYLRYGRFHDKRTNRFGSAFGFSWVGPRFSFEFANKFSELISEKTDTIFIDETELQTSMNITVIF